MNPVNDAIAFALYLMIREAWSAKTPEGRAHAKQMYDELSGAIEAALREDDTHMLAKRQA